MYRFISLIALSALLLSGCQQPYGTTQRPVFNGGPLFADNFGPIGNSSWWRDGHSNPWWTANGTTPGANNNRNLQANNSVPWWEQGNLQNPTRNSGNPGLNIQQNQVVADLNRQVEELRQKLSRFDNVNSGIETEVASLQQKLQIATDHNYQLRQQLADSAVQLQQMQNAIQQAEQRTLAAENQSRQMNTSAQEAIRNASQNANQVPSHLAGAPTIRANNSLMAKLPNLQIGGVHARMDGDVIRIEIPSDPLFVQGSYQIQASHQNMLTQLSQAIRQHFPRQVVGIEAHWDRTPVQSTTHQQLTATQALSVFNYMQQIGVPEQQMFTMAMGSSRPKYASASGQDRRVDIVIYPETYNSN